MTMTPNKTRACVKSTDTKFGNDHIFDMANFDESSKWIEWSKNEFSHSLSLQATRAGRFRRRCAMARQASSASRFSSFGPAWLRLGGIMARL